MMQEFNAQPQMTSPYASVGSGNMSPNMPSAPSLGTPIPGMVGGLPAKPGLTVYQNPLASQLQSNPQDSAQQLQSYGRGQDTQLIHMTPDEVGGLQALAMAHGGSLTINPHTGLPEAGFLGKILPTLLGAVGAAFGLPTWALIGGGVLGGTIASGGDLGKGLMAGLGAWGGAGLAGGLGLGKAGASAITAGHEGVDVASKIAEKSAEAAGQAGAAGQTAAQLGNLTTTSVPGAMPGVMGEMGTGAGAAITPAAVGLPHSLAGTLAQGASTVPGAGLVSTAGQVGVPKTGLAKVLEGFNTAARKDMPGFLAKYAPYAAGLGLVNTVSDLATPEMPKYDPDKEKSQWHYAKPQKPPAREVSFQTPEQMRQSGGAEYTYFTPSNPMPGYTLDQTVSGEGTTGYADGGLADLKTPEGFNDLVSYFGASNPGAITASRTYPSTAATATSQTAAPAASQGEQKYTFTNPKVTGSNATSATTGGIPSSFSIPGIGNFSIPNMSSADIQALIAQYQAGAGAGAGAGATSGATGGSGQQDQTQGTPPTEQLSPAQQLNALRNPQGNEPSTRQLAPVEPAAPVTPATPATPSSYTPGVGGFQLPDFSKMDLSQYTQGQQAAPVQQPPEVMPPPNVDYSNYVPDYYSYQYAGGGNVNMQDGSFVVDARTVSELGNGSSNAGMDLLSRMGGQPVRGPGDGVSDSIRASIGGRQQARVARDEVIMPPQAVARLGGGSQQRGTQKLYALMDKAHKARKRAGRGSDTKLARGLGAIA